MASVVATTVKPISADSAEEHAAKAVADDRANAVRKLGPRGRQYATGRPGRGLVRVDEQAGPRGLVGRRLVGHATRAIGSRLRVELVVSPAWNW